MSLRIFVLYIFTPFALEWRHMILAPQITNNPTICSRYCSFSLQWRHNERHSVSDHQPHDCLFYCLFRRRSKKIAKLCVTGLCAGNSPGTGDFPAQMASNAENVSIWWRHHVVENTKPRIIYGLGLGLNFLRYWHLQQHSRPFNLCMWCHQRYPPILSNWRLWIVCLTHFMCHHEVWPTSVNHTRSFLNNPLGHAGWNITRGF